MNTRRMTMAQALVEFLTHQYVRFDGCEERFVRGVMGIFGHGNVLGLGQALSQRQADLPFYQGKNEQTMAHIATAFAKQQRRRAIMACTASVGPGSANMVTAAATATVNRIPVLFLPSDHFAARQPDPVLQQVEMPHEYGLSVTDCFRPVSRYWDRVDRPAQLMTAALNAMRVLTDPAETGAVTLALPQDVQAEAYDYPVSFFRRRVWDIDRPICADRILQSALALISGKQKPLLICGGGVRYSDAGEALLRLAEAFAMPIVETQAGKGILPPDHPLNLGGIGVCGTLAANQIARTADVVIAIGTRLNDFVTASKSGFQNTDVDFININIARSDSLKLDGLAIVADAKSAIERLHGLLQERGYRASHQLEVDEARERWVKERLRLEQAEVPSEGLSQTKVVLELNRLLDEDSVIVASSGSLPSDVQRLWRTQVSDGYHVEYGFSCMGYEIAGAIGARMASPEREVYALVGDGAYLMANSELFTSVHEGIKINVIVFDNSGFQCIHNLQRSQGASSFGNEFRRRVQETGLTGAYAPVDFAAHARSMGATCFTVRTMDELKSAVLLAKKADVSTVIDIKVLPGTMTEGYDSWWRVGVAEVAEDPTVEARAREMAERVHQARPY